MPQRARLRQSSIVTNLLPYLTYTVVYVIFGHTGRLQAIRGPSAILICTLKREMLSFQSKLTDNGGQRSPPRDWQSTSVQSPSPPTPLHPFIAKFPPIGNHLCPISYCITGIGVNLVIASLYQLHARLNHTWYHNRIDTMASLLYRIQMRLLNYPHKILITMHIDCWNQWI